MSRRTDRYRERLAARRCIDCAAGLLETDGSRCLECTAKAIATRRRYRRSKKARQVERARLRRRYARRRVARRCVDCAELAAPGRARCERHLAAHAAAAALYLDRRDGLR